MALQSIYDVLMICDNCGWVGKVIDCEPDVDGDGGLGCPNCNEVCRQKESLGK